MSNTYTYSNKLFTVSEAGSILGISKNTVRRWERSGKIEVERTEGGHRRISTGEVQRLLFEKRIKSQARNGYKRRSVFNSQFSVFKSKYTQLSSRTYHLRSSAYNLRRLLRSNRRKTIPALLIPLIILISIAGYITFRPSDTEAGWWNDNWQYRKRITYGNSGSAISSERKVLIEVDTAALTTAKLQSDCDDIRFTDHNGRLLDYFIDTDAGACDTSSTDFYIRLPGIDAGTNTVYMYYGNPSANNVRKNDFFDDNNLAVGLKAYWKLDEASANTCQNGTDDSCDSGQSNDGAWVGNTASTTGKFDNGLTFDGNGDRVSKSSFTLNNSFTYSAWIEVPGTWTQKYPVAIGMRNSGSTLAAEFMAAHGGITDRPHFQIRTGGAWYTATGPSAMSAGWHHVAGVLDTTAQKVRIYIDGSETEGSTLSSFSMTETMYLGDSVNASAGDGDFDFNGKLDDVRVYNTALTASQISAIYNGGDGLTIDTPITFSPTSGPTQASEEVGPGPVAYWKFDEGYGQTVNDQTANENNGSLGVGGSAPSWQSEEFCIDGNCLSLDGTDDFVEFDSNVSNIEGKNTGTITGWFRSNSTGRQHIFHMAEETTANNFVYLGLNNITGDFSDESLWFNVRRDGGNSKLSMFVRNGDGYYSDNKWHHFAVATGDGDNRIFIDGIRQQLTIDYGTISTNEFSDITNGDIMRIGHRRVSSSSDGHFDGFLDEVKIYPYARSASEILEDYNRGAQVLGINDDSWLSDGLVGYWKLDEASPGNGCSGGEDSCDSSGNGNHGTWSGHADSAVGKYGNGVTFDGTDDWVSLGNPSDLNISGNISVASWVKFSASQTNRRFVSRWGTDQSYSLGIYSAGSDLLSFTVRVSEVSKKATSTDTYNDGNWHHVVGIFDGSNVKLIIDGGKETIIGDATSGPIDTPSENVYFGAYSNGTGDFTGQLDEVRIFNRALSTSEVSKLYQWAPGPVGYWKMDEGSWNNDCSTDTVFDSSGNGNDGDSCPNTSGPTGGAVGKYGKAGEFDGSDDYVSIPDSSTLRPGNGSWSVSVWAKPSNSDQTTALISKRQASGDYEQWSLNICGNDGCGVDGQNLVGFFRQSDAVERRAISTSDVVDGNWHNYAMVADKDANGIYLYLDGIQQPTTLTTDGAWPTVNNTDLLYIGGQNGSNLFNGQIDDVQVYNYARTPQQIVQDMNAGHPAPGSPVGSALGHWKFDEGYGDTANDSGIGGNNGDLAGSCPGAGTCPTWIYDGKFGKTLEFDGTGDYLTVPHDSSLEPEEVTLSTWIYFDSSLQADSSVTIIEKPHSSHVSPFYNYSLKLWSTEGANPTFVPHIVVGAYSAADTHPIYGVLEKDTWQHVAATFDGNDMKAYINGVYWGAKSNPGSINYSQQDLYVGKNKNITTSDFPGKIDEVKIFNSALTADQVKLLYNQGSVSFGVLGDSEASDLIDGEGNPPVAHWSMDEGSWNNDCSTDTVFDISGNENHGDACPNTTGPTGNAIGKYGNAGYFDGNDYIPLGTITNLSPTDAVTVQAWVKTTGTVSAVNTVLDRTESNDGYGLSLDSSGNPRLSINGGTALPTSSVDVDDSEWHFIVGTYDKDAGGTDEAKIYVDGTPKGTANYSAAITYTPEPRKQIGRSITSNYFNGYIDELKIYNYARTKAQIMYDYNRGKPIGWWKFDTCQGTTAYDSGGGNNGTITPGAGTNTSAGTCSSGAGDEMWDNGTTGKRNASLDFDASDDFVSLTNIDMSSDISVAFWTKANSASNWQTIFGRTNLCTSTTRGWSPGWIYFDSEILEYEVKETGNCSSGASKDVYSSDNSVVSVGQWSHFVVTAENNSTEGRVVTMYKDGQLIPSTQTTNNTVPFIQNGSQKTYIGHCYNTAHSNCNSFDGQIDDVRFYNYTLSETQIRKIMNESAVRFGPVEGSP